MHGLPRASAEALEDEYASVDLVGTRFARNKSLSLTCLGNRVAHDPLAHLSVRVEQHRFRHEKPVFIVVENRASVYGFEHPFKGKVEVRTEILDGRPLLT